MISGNSCVFSTFLRFFSPFPSPLFLFTFPTFCSPVLIARTFGIDALSQKREGDMPMCDLNSSNPFPCRCAKCSWWTSSDQWNDLEDCLRNEKKTASIPSRSFLSFAAICCIVLLLSISIVWYTKINSWQCIVRSSDITYCLPNEKIFWSATRLSWATSAIAFHVIHRLLPANQILIYMRFIVKSKTKLKQTESRERAKEEKTTNFNKINAKEYFRRGCAPIKITLRMLVRFLLLRFQNKCVVLKWRSQKLLTEFSDTEMKRKIM